MVKVLEEKIKRIMKLIEETKEGVTVTVFVKTNSDAEELRLENDELVFYTKEPDLYGRANASLIRFFTRSLGIPISKIDIVYGTRENLKKVLIKDADKETIINKIVGVLGDKK